MSKGRRTQGLSVPWSEWETIRAHLELMEELFGVSVTFSTLARAAIQEKIKRDARKLRKLKALLANAKEDADDA